MRTDAIRNRLPSLTEDWRPRWDSNPRSCLAGSQSLAESASTNEPKGLEPRFAAPEFPHFEANQRDSNTFWTKVDQSAGPDACWPCTARKDRDGYGVVHFSGKARRAHRVAFFLTHGHWPEPICLHACDSRDCCNPRHLHEGTQAQNVRECVERGRTAAGSLNGRYTTGENVGRHAARIEYMRAYLPAWRARKKAST